MVFGLLFSRKGNFDVLNPKSGPPDDTDPRSRKSTGDPQILAVSGKYKLCNPHTPSDSRPLSRQATFLLKFLPDPPTRSVARRSTAWERYSEFPKPYSQISRKGQEASFEKTLPRKVSKEYEKSLLRKRQGLLHFFFSLEIVDNKDNFIISWVRTLYSLTEHFHNDFFSPLLLQPPLKDKFTLHWWTWIPS